VYPIKPISASGVARALEKAERYRLLNDPLAAESICLDVLEVEPDNQRALTMLLLARTDQFASGVGAGVAEARRPLSRLAGDYDRSYYAGVIAERKGKALLQEPGPGRAQMAYHHLREAMEHYEKAAARRPAGNDDALLRWNTCARLLNAHPELEPTGEEEEFAPILGD